MQLSPYKSAFVLILTIPTVLNTMELQVTIQPRVGNPVKISLSTAQSSNLIKNLTSDPILDSTKSIPLDINEQDIALLLPFMELEKAVDKQKSVPVIQQRLTEVGPEKCLLLAYNANYLDMPVLLGEAKTILINFFKQNPEVALKLIKKIELPNDSFRLLEDELAYPLLEWLDSPAHLEAIAKFTKVDDGGNGFVYGSCLSVDNNYAAIGGANSARIWSLKDNTLLAELPHPDNVSAVQFDRDSKLLVTGCADGNLRLWDLLTIRDKACIQRIHFSSGILSIVFNQDNSLAGINTDDSTLHVFNTASWEETHSISNCSGTIPTRNQNLVITKDNRDTGGLYATKIHLLDIKTGNYLWSSNNSNEHIICTATNSSGTNGIKAVRMYMFHDRLFNWSSSTGEDSCTNWPNVIDAACYTYDDHSLIIGEIDQYLEHVTIRIISGKPDAHKRYTFLELQTNNISHLCCNSDNMCLCCSRYGTVILWDLSAHKFRKQLKGKLTLEQGLVLHSLYKALIENDKAHLKCQHDERYKILEPINHHEFKETLKKHIQTISSKWCWRCTLNNNKVIIAGTFLLGAAALTAGYFYKKS